VSNQRYYTTQLQAGLGLMEETKQLLDVYQPGMSAPALYDAALASGRFPLVTARRLRNIVAECFAPRYLRGPGVAAHLRRLAPQLSSAELAQLFFLYTARANLVLADFVRDVFWPRYAAGRNDLELEDARAFVVNSAREGKTQKRGCWQLRFSGLGDNQVVSHPDWQLFGLVPHDVRDQLKRLSLQGHLIFQAASDVVHIGWAYKNMEEVIDVIAQS